MKKELIGIFVCMLLIGTTFSVSGTFSQKLISEPEKLNREFIISDNENIGVSGLYGSLDDIPAPDGKKYPCLMYCNNNDQVSKWISQIDESGFDKTWQLNFIKLAILFITPGTIILFGLNDFLIWYMQLLIIKKHRDEYLDFMDNYDELNTSGMVTYIWSVSSTKTLIDFKIQPDDTWIEDSWILDNIDNYIPNPDIWIKKMSFVPF